jgi:hypothetical protein
MCQNAAITPTTPRACEATFAKTTDRDPSGRRRNISSSLSRMRAARRGSASANATTLTVAARSSDGAVRNGCTNTTPTPINPP